MIHTQRNNNQDVIVKFIVTFDSINNNPRRNLNNKMRFADYKKGLINNVLDYLYYTYDTDKTKNIYVIGDGCKWIKVLSNYFQFNNSYNVIYALDKFHFKQALHHIFLNKELEKSISNYIINYDKKIYKSVCYSNRIISTLRRNNSKKERIYNK